MLKLDKTDHCCWKWWCIIIWATCRILCRGIPLMEQRLLVCTYPHLQSRNSFASQCLVYTVSIHKANLATGGQPNIDHFVPQTGAFRRSCKHWKRIWGQRKGCLYVYVTLHVPRIPCHSLIQKGISLRRQTSFLALCGFISKKHLGVIGIVRSAIQRPFQWYITHSIWITETPGIAIWNPLALVRECFDYVNTFWFHSDSLHLRWKHSREPLPSTRPSLGLNFSFVMLHKHWDI